MKSAGLFFIQKYEVICLWNFVIPHLHLDFLLNTYAYFESYDILLSLDDIVMLSRLKEPSLVTYVISLKHRMVR